MIDKGRGAYKALKMELARLAYNARDLAEVLDRSLPYVQVRMRGADVFDLLEAYKILELLNLPDSQLPVIFPRDPWEEVSGPAYRSRRVQ